MKGEIPKKSRYGHSVLTYKKDILIYGGSDYTNDKNLYKDASQPEFSNTSLDYNIL